MSDLRHCDGPGCDRSDRLDVAESMWLTVTGGISTLSANGKDKHFHDETCLKKWAEEKVNRVARN